MKTVKRPEPKALRQQPKKEAAQPAGQSKPKAQAPQPKAGTAGKVIKVICPEVGKRRMSFQTGVGEAFANPMKDGRHRCTVCKSTDHPPVPVKT